MLTQSLGKDVFWSLGSNVSKLAIEEPAAKPKTRVLQSVHERRNGQALSLTQTSSRFKPTDNNNSLRARNQQEDLPNFSPKSTLLSPQLGMLVYMLSKDSDRSTAISVARQYYSSILLLSGRKSIETEETAEEAEEEEEGRGRGRKRGDGTKIMLYRTPFLLQDSTASC